MLELCIGHSAPATAGNMDLGMTKHENWSRKELLSQAESPAPPGAAEWLGLGYFGELRGQMLITHFLLPCKFFCADSVLQRGIRSRDAWRVMGLALSSSSWPSGLGHGRGFCADGYKLQQS